MCDFHDQETTLGGRTPSPETFVSRGRIDPISGSVGASQESSTRLTEDRDVDDVARGVAVLFPSRSSPRPWAGLCPLPTIREESASEDEDERESVGSRAPGTETDVLSDTPAHACCHQPIHVTCMIRSFYRMEEWKCPHCRRMLASGLWGPIENVKIDPSLWPLGTFENLDAFVQRRLTLTDHELFHLMHTGEEKEEDVLMGR